MVQNDLDVKEFFRKRLIAALRENELPEHGQGTWLAKKMGVTPKATNKWINGESMPDQRKWSKLADVLNKSRAYFYEGMEIGAGLVSAVNETNATYGEPTNDQPVEYPSQHAKIAFYVNSALSAGPGHTAHDENTIEEIAFRRDWLTKKGFSENKLVAVPCSGDSMEPTIRNGELVLINTDDSILRDNKIYAINFGEEALLKRVYRHYDGGYILRSDNNIEADRKVPAEEVELLRVIGRAVWHGGDL